jgi:hypothetical protein
MDLKNFTVPELTQGAFLERAQEDTERNVLAVVKVILLAPVFVCALAGLLAAAIVFAPFIPFVELWRKFYCR